MTNLDVQLRLRASATSLEALVSGDDEDAAPGSEGRPSLAAAAAAAASPLVYAARFSPRPDDGAEVPSRPWTDADGAPQGGDAEHAPRARARAQKPRQVLVPPRASLPAVPLGSAAASLRGRVLVDVYNLAKLGWEPAAEPFTLQASGAESRADRVSKHAGLAR